MKHYCKEASQLMSDRFDRELSLTERLRLRLHLLICGMCRNYASNLSLLNRMFATIRKRADEQGTCLPEKARQRIEENLIRAMHSNR